MSEATSVQARIHVPGKKRTKLQRHLTLEMISGWIKLQGFDEYTTNGLIELASRYPTQALPSFRKNFNLMIERVREKRRKEQMAQENEMEAQKAQSMLNPVKEQNHAQESSETSVTIPWKQPTERLPECEDTCDDLGAED